MLGTQRMVRTEMKHRNVPVFVTHQGCPHKCVFCDQKKITGTSDTTPESADIELSETFRNESEKDTEIAFFGGSFTAIERGRMIKYLEVAKKYVDEGKATSIRLSTRPDALSDEILQILRDYGVGAIEIGVQSLSDRVLEASKRGHTAGESLEAMKRVKKYGFELTGQMMTGLPESTFEDEMATARGIIECGADKARIYPTAVFMNTELEELYRSGKYLPPTVSESVGRCAGIARLFIENGVDILRIGLCVTDFGEARPVAGAFHEAMGEMVYSRIYRDLIEEKANGIPGERVTVFVNPGEISKAVGQKRENALYLEEKFSPVKFSFRGDGDLSKYEVRIEKCT